MGGQGGERHTAQAAGLGVCRWARECCWRRRVRLPAKHEWVQSGGGPQDRGTTAGSCASPPSRWGSTTRSAHTRKVGSWALPGGVRPALLPFPRPSLPTQAPCRRTLCSLRISLYSPCTSTTWGGLTASRKPLVWSKSAWALKLMWCTPMRRGTCAHTHTRTCMHARHWSIARGCAAPGRGAFQNAGMDERVKVEVVAARCHGSASAHATTMPRPVRLTRLPSLVVMDVGPPKISLARVP